MHTLIELEQSHKCLLTLPDRCFTPPQSFENHFRGVCFTWENLTIICRKCVFCSAAPSKSTPTFKGLLPELHPVLLSVRDKRNLVGKVGKGKKRKKSLDFHAKVEGEQMQ